MQTSKPQQTFTLKDLSGQDIEAIMTGLGELQAKQSRTVMNKLETQIVQQLQVQELQKQSLAKSNSNEE
jgi:hypothetical protein